MSAPDSPGLRGHPSRAPHWPDRVFPRWPPADILTFTGIHVNTLFTSTKTTNHFLHMEHSNTAITQISHILFPVHINISHQHYLSAHADTSAPFKNAAYTDALVSLLEGATDNGGSNQGQPTRYPYPLPRFISLYTSCSSPHIITSA